MRSFLGYLKERKIILEDLIEIKTELVNRFGNNIESENYHLTTDDAKFIFNLLNRIIFKNKLENIEIYVEKYDKTKHTTDKGEIFIGRHIIIFDMDSIDLNDPNFYPKYINKILIVDMNTLTVMNYVETICHEMIHEYDFMYSDGREEIFSYVLDKYYGLDPEPYNDHGESFTRIADKVYKNYGINVVTTFNVSNKKFKNMIMEIDKNEPCPVKITDGSNTKVVEIAKKMARGIKNTGTTEIEVIGTKVLVKTI